MPRADSHVITQICKLVSNRWTPLVHCHFSQCALKTRNVRLIFVCAQCHILENLRYPTKGLPHAFPYFLTLSLDFFKFLLFYQSIFSNISLTCKRVLVQSQTKLVHRYCKLYFVVLRTDLKSPMTSWCEIFAR